ncbi:MAG: PilN domain-containing protein [Pseudomonadota bacterium]|nr:PilN domain-containing protein [Pseudomonadota bacterium]
MKQQVNLYLPIFQKKSAVFSARTMAQVALVFVVGLMAIYGFSLRQSHYLEREVARLESKRDAALIRLEALGQRATPKEKSRALEARLARLSRELRQKREVVSLVRQEDLGNIEGFSEHLAGLARQRVDGLWLTGVDISDGGKDITLRGTTQQEVLVPRFLQLLADESVFRGTGFRYVQLERAEHDANWVNFQMRTRLETES